MMLSDMVDSVIVLNDEHCKENKCIHEKEMQTTWCTIKLSFIPYIEWFWWNKILSVTVPNLPHAIFCMILNAHRTIILSTDFKATSALTYNLLNSWSL